MPCTGYRGPGQGGKSCQGQHDGVIPLWFLLVVDQIEDGLAALPEEHIVGRVWHGEERTCLFTHPFSHTSLGGDPLDGRCANEFTRATLRGDFKLEKRNVRGRCTRGSCGNLGFDQAAVC